MVRGIGSREGMRGPLGIVDRGCWIQDWSTFVELLEIELIHKFRIQVQGITLGLEQEFISLETIYRINIHPFYEDIGSLQIGFLV